MNECGTISCEVCADLAPLVQDDVASAASAVLVRTHLDSCAACRARFPDLCQGLDHPPAAAQPDDARVLKKLRDRMNLWLFLFLAAGILLGTALFFSPRHGILVMLIYPLIGGLAYWTGPSRCKWVLVAAALLASYTQVMNAVANPGDSWYDILASATTAAGVAVLLCLAGIAVAALFRFAFQGGKKNDNKN